MIFFKESAYHFSAHHTKGKTVENEYMWGYVVWLTTNFYRRQQKKRKVIAEINEALEGPCDFLVKSEIEKNPGSVAWHYLAREFCEKLAEHVDEFIEQVGGVNSIEGHEIGDIYMAYEDGNEDIYELLPVEAQLFAAE